MGLMKEFRDFAMRGNVVDLAVGVVIGGAFGKIVTTLVGNIIMPVVGFLTSGVDLSKASYPLKMPALDGGEAKVIELGWGPFAQAIIDFIVIAFVIFMVVKAMNTAKAKFAKEEAAAPPAAPPEDVVLLREIRDALKKG